MANTPEDPIRPESGDKNDRKISGEAPPSPPAEPQARQDDKAGTPPTGRISDSSVDLSTPSEGVDLSDVSVIEWGSLAERHGVPTVTPPGTPTIEEMRPSTPTADEDALMADLADSGIDLAESIPPIVESPAPRGQGEDSAIDLGADAVMEPPASASVQSDDSAIDLGEDAIVIDETPPHMTDEGSAIDLGDDAVFVEGTPPVIAGSEADIDLASSPGSSSVVSLTSEVSIEGSDPLSASGSESTIQLSEAPLTDSGIDLITAPPSRVVAGFGAAPQTESGIELMPEDVILEEPSAKSPSSGGSSRDLIAEGLESGVGLGGDKKKTSIETAEDALEDFLAQVGTEDPSSSVDLGSTHSMEMFKEEELASKIHPGGPGDSDISIEDLTSGKLSRKPAAPLSEEDIDLGVEEPVKGKTTAKKAGKATVALETPSSVDLGEMAAIEEEAVEEEVAEEKPAKGKPAKEAKARGGAGAWVGGTVLGAVLGTAACLGVWTLGIDPPDALRNLVGTGKTKGPSGGQPGTGTGPAPVVPQRTFAQVMDEIQSGALDKVKPDDLEKVDANNNDHLVARAEYLWLDYLRKERGKDPKAALKADADAVKRALADLDKPIQENHADALFLRGQIHEMTGNVAAAKADYEKGLAQFKADEKNRKRFEAALRILQLPPRVAQLLPAGIQPRWLALMLFAFQEGGEPAAPEEAGHRFWDAVKLAREKKYAEALKALQSARENHDRRRYLFPRKPQNPTTDPREEIFLRACEELTAYWTLLNRLDNPNYLAAAPANRIKPVDDLLRKVDDAARTAVLKDVASRLVKDKPVAKVDDLVKILAEERKQSAERVVTLEKTSEKQQDQIKSLSENLDNTLKSLKATTDKLTATVMREKQLAAANKDAETALRDVSAALGTKFTDVKASSAELVRAARETKRAAGVVDPSGAIRKLERDLALSQESLKQRWSPVEMLSIWRSHLQKDRDSKDLSAKALTDARRVLEDPAASEAHKGQALLVRGLALRNEQKFAEAQPALEKARAALEKTMSPWLEDASQALSEVANPAAGVAEKARALASRGQQKEALDLLERGLKAAGENKGPLYAQRARIGLEAARSRGTLAADDPLVLAARKDAAAAAKAGEAEGHFVLGRLAEERGQIEEAVASYREAIKAHGKLDAVGGRYRVALARVLLRQQAGDTAPRPLPPTRTSKADRPTRKLVPLDIAHLLLLFTLQAPDLPTTGARAREADKLADEVLALGDKVPFDVRAQALAVKGLHTEALTTYTAGLREKGLLSPEYANALIDLVAAHPTLRRPESLTVADPLAAEKHYAAGLNFFAARRFADAEKEFLAAVKNDSGDARYYYYLGLARLAQGKRDALEDFDQAARLERVGRPDRATVSSALERIQGSMRRVLNEVRNRPGR